ncbi:MAG TPA: protein-S-isoprenylcysteine methyltransferase [Allosphingosinicella sp.]|jgi:protein-S-isoprenylcysteine O-methyltransferase Ste14
MNAQSQIAASFAADERPKSAVSTGVGLAGCLGLLAWTAASRAYGMVGPFAALAALVACGVPMILWSLLVDKVHRHASTGIAWDRPARPLRDTLDGSIVKIAGLWATWAIIAFAYCIGRWYWDGQYLFAMYVLGIGSIGLLVVSIPYIIWLDRRVEDVRDGAWHFGQLVAGRRHLADPAVLQDYARGWAIKGFFLAFMISALPYNWEVVIAPSSRDITANPINFTIWLAHASFMVDVSFATVGYMLTLKPLDSHIRSANPFAVAWIAALLCYPPFSPMQGGGPLDYRSGTGEWTYWLDSWPLAMVAVGIAIAFLHCVYAWATVAFGPRFSNLTHRGILTHGPYAWTKHPAYISKNITWWLMTLPFLATTGDPADMIRNTALLGIVSGVYYWRARTEERHLMADPDYRRYAEWIERNGLIARLRRAFRPAEPEGGPLSPRLPA